MQAASDADPGASPLNELPMEVENCDGSLSGLNGQICDCAGGSAFGDGSIPDQSAGAGGA